jgi:hypothetical protein
MHRHNNHVSIERAGGRQPLAKYQAQRPAAKIKTREQLSIEGFRLGREQ